MIRMEIEQIENGWLLKVRYSGDYSFYSVPKYFKTHKELLRYLDDLLEKRES